MICDITQIPFYINNLDVSDKEKQDLRNLHYSAKARLENLTDEPNTGFKRILINGKEYISTDKSLSDLNSFFPEPVYFIKEIDGNNVVGIDVSNVDVKVGNSDFIQFIKGKLDGSKLSQEIEGKLEANKDRLIELLGSSMYSEKLKDVVYKELLQNAFDAVKIAESKGLIEKGKIDIVIDEKERIISFIDNGIGMTPDIVQKAFFTIGGTYKGDNVDNKLKSGGLGLAKMAFIFGSEKLNLETIHNGIRTTVDATSQEIRTDNFKIKTEPTTEKNSTKISVKIPKTYTDSKGEARDLDFPKYIDSELEYSFLKNPMIGNVDVSYSIINKESYFNKEDEKVNTNLGKLPEGYILFSPASTSFADMDIYIDTRNISTKSYRTKHNILSSGLYQFDVNFETQDEKKIPLNIIIDIKPKVSAENAQYPFNNQRENFKPTVQSDITALKKYLQLLWKSIEIELLKNSFSKIKNIEKLNIENIEESIIEKNKEIVKDFTKVANSEIITKAIKEFTEKNEKAIIEEGGVKTKTQEYTKEEITKDSEKSYNRTFEAEKEIKINRETGLSLNYNKPIVHNNTTMHFNENATKFLSEISSIMIEYKKSIIDFYGEDYSENIKTQLWGVSIDKTYGGVNVNPSFVNMLAINPFYNFPDNPKVDAVNYIAVALDHLIIHELNHNFERNEGSNFTGRFLTTYSEIHSLPNYFELISKLKLSIKNNLETIKILNYEYQQSENVESGFEGNKLKTDNKTRTDNGVESVLENNTKNNGFSNSDDKRSNNEFGEIIKNINVNKSTENILFSLSDITQYYINEDTKNKIFRFFENLGFKIDNQNQILQRLGIKAYADLTNKLVGFLEGHEDKLPEEAAHILFSILDKNSPIYKEAMSEITSYDLYQKVLDKYSNDKEYKNEDGSPNLEKIKEEAVGQLIAQQVYRINQNIPLSSSRLSKEDKPLNWLQRLIVWVKSLFQDKLKNDVFAKLANDILTENTSITSDYIQADMEAKGVFFSKAYYEEIAESLAKVNLTPLLDKVRQSVIKIKELSNKVKTEEDLRHHYTKHLPKESPLKSSKELSSVLNSIASDIRNLKSKEQTETIETTIANLAKTYYELVEETHKMYEDYNVILQNISLLPTSTPDERGRLLLELNHVITSVILLDSVNDELNHITKELPIQHPLSVKIGEMEAYKKRIHELYFKAALDASTSTLWNELYKDMANRLKNDYTQRTEELKKKFTLGVDNNGKPVSESSQKQAKVNYDKAWKEFADKVPSETKIRQILTGELGDSGLVTSIFGKAIGNPDVIIAGLATLVEEQLYDSFKYLQKIKNDTQAAQDKFIRQTGSNINKDKETFDPITEEVTFIKGKDEEGKPIEVTEYWLLSPVDPKYKLTIDDFRRQIDEASFNKITSKTKEDYEKFEKEEKELKRKFTLWTNENSELPFTEEFYKLTSDLLEQELTDNSGNKFTVKEQLQDIWDKLESERKALLNSTGISNAEFHWEQLQALESQLKTLRISDGLPEGSKEYLTAKQLQLYYANKSKVQTTEITQSSLDSWNALKAIYTKRVNEEANPETKIILQKILNSFTIKGETNEYKKKKEKITSRISQIADYAKDIQNSEINKELEKLKNKITNTSGKEKDVLEKELAFKSLSIKDLYNKIFTLANPARKVAFDNLEDELDGNYFNDKLSSVELIKKYEERIEEIKANTVKLTGDTTANKLKRAKLKEEFSELTAKKQDVDWLEKNYDIEAIDKRLEEIEFELLKIEKKQTPLAESVIEEYYQLVQELADMTESTVTEAYENRQGEEIAKLKDSITENVELPSLFVSREGIQYVKGETEYVNPINQEIKLPFSEIEEILKQRKAESLLQTSEWFLNNHFKITKWVPNEDYVDGTMDSKGDYQEIFQPLYIWRKSSPKNIYLEDQPSFKFRERVVNKEFINKGHTKDIQGYNVPRKGKFINPKYKTLQDKSKNDGVASAQLEFLQKMTSLYHSQQLSIDNESQRPGNRLPTFAKGKFEDLTDTNVTTFFNNIFQRTKRAFTETAQDKDDLYGDYGTFEDDMISQIPVLYKGDLDINLQLRDVTKLILLYTAHSATRTQLTKAKPLANALLKITGSVDIKKPNPFPALGKVGKIAKEIFKPSERGNRHKAVSEFIKSNFLFEQEKPAVIGGIDVNKVTNQVLNFSSVSILGLKIVSPIKNNLTGTLNLALESVLHPEAIGKYNWAKAKLYVTVNQGFLWKDMVKEGNKSLLGQIIEHFDILQGNFIDEYGHNIDWSKERYFSNINNIIMSTKNLMEFEQHIMNGVAILLSYKVDYLGKKINLLEAYELKNGVLLLKDGITLDRKTEHQVRRLISDVNSKTNGNFKGIDKAPAQKYWYAKGFYHMSKYIVPMLTNMYSSARLNTQTGRIEKGYYYATFTQIVNDFKNKEFNIIKNYKNLEPQEQRYQQAVLMQTALIMAMSMLYALGGGDEKDKYKKLKYDYLNAQYLNLLFAVNNEFQTLTPIAGSDNLLRKAQSPFVVFSTIKLLRRTLLAGLASIPGATSTPFFKDTDAFYSKNTGIWKKGDSKFIADIAKLLALEGFYKDVIAPEEALKSKEQSQNF